MRIVRLEAIPIALPFRERYRTASGELDAREMAIVRLHTDTGPSGLGEAVPLSLRGGPSLTSVLAEIAACEPVVVGAGVAAPLGRVPSRSGPGSTSCSAPAAAAVPAPRH